MNKKIVVYYSLGIGNFLLLTPTIKALCIKNRCRNVDIVIPISERSEYIKEICEQWDLIDKIYMWPDDEINFSEYDTMLNPWSEDSSIRQIMLSNIKNIIDINKIPWNYSTTHEVERNLSSVIDLDKYDSRNHKLYCPIKQVDFFIKYKSGKINNKRLISFCNSSFNNPMWNKKKVKNSLFLALFLGIIYSNDNIDIVLIGGKEDMDFGNYFEKRIDIIKNRLHNCVGHFSISETAYIIKQSDLLITTDTFALHMAAAVDTPTISLFGPTIPSKNSAWPESVKHGIIQKKETCPYNVMPCYPGEKWLDCNNNICMQSIDVKDIIDKMIEMELWEK